MRRWVAGESPIPDGTWGQLRMLCKVRRIRLAAIEKAIAKR
jgi:hypothetical protein